MSKLEKIEKLLAQARRLAGKNPKLQKYIRENVVDVDISPAKVSKLFEKGDKLAKQKDMLNALPMDFDFEAPSQKTRDERVAKLTSKKTLFIRYKFKLQERFKVADDEWTKWYTQTHIQVTSFVSASTDLGSIKGRIIEMARALSNVVTPYYESKFIKLVHYAIIDRSRFIKKVDITRLRMKRATPLKLDWLPEVDNISLACTNNKCVEAAFEERYSKARRPKTAKDLYKYCNEYYIETYMTGGGAQYGYKFGSLDAENGYDCHMLAYACQMMDITFMCFDTNHKLLIKQLSKNQNLPPWVFYCVDEHVYMITDKKTLETIVKTNADRVVSSMFHVENEDIKELPVSEFSHIMDLEVIKAPSIVIVQQSELSDIFRDIIMNTDCIPMVKNKGERTIKEIIYTRKDKLKVYIQCDANNGTSLNYKDIQGLCKKLDIPFVNQGMGTLIRDYYGRFISPSRKKIDRQLFFEKLGRECVTCGCVNSPQIDHIIALANGGADDESNYQVLCKPCHYAKTKGEKEEGYVKIPVIESSFNNRVREIFDSDLMKKWAFVEKLGNYKSLYGYDINKCRKNILYYSKYEWPVFSVMDDVAKFDGDIRCGFYYIESSNLFPLHGNGWYSEPIIKYCLELNIISLSDIKYQIVSVLDQINCDYFRPFIDLVYNTF